MSDNNDTKQTDGLPGEMYPDMSGEPDPPILVGSVEARGFYRGIAHERARIVKWLREEGPLNIGRPHVASPTEKCPHDSYRWDDCAECTLLDMADMIEAGENDE